MPVERPRATLIVVFLLGLLTGALALYFYLWRTGGLTPGHPLARAKLDVGWGRGGNPPSVTVTAQTPAPAAPAPVASVPSGTSPAAPEDTPEALQFTPLAGFTLGREPLVMPVEGARAEDLRDSFEEKRGEGPRRGATRRSTSWRRAARRWWRRWTARSRSSSQACREA